MPTSSVPSQPNSGPLTIQPNTPQTFSGTGSAAGVGGPGTSMVSTVAHSPARSALSSPPVESVATLSTPHSPQIMGTTLSTPNSPQMMGIDMNDAASDTSQIPHTQTLEEEAAAIAAGGESAGILSVGDGSDIWGGENDVHGSAGQQQSDEDKDNDNDADVFNLSFGHKIDQVEGEHQKGGEAVHIAQLVADESMFSGSEDAAPRRPHAAAADNTQALDPDTAAHEHRQEQQQHQQQQASPRQSLQSKLAELRAKFEQPARDLTPPPVPRRHSSSSSPAPTTNPPFAEPPSPSRWATSRSNEVEDARSNEVEDASAAGAGRAPTQCLGQDGNMAVQEYIESAAHSDAEDEGNPERGEEQDAAQPGGSSREAKTMQVENASGQEEVLKEREAEAEAEAESDARDAAASHTTPNTLAQHKAESDTVERVVKQEVVEAVKEVVGVVKEVVEVVEDKEVVGVVKETEVVKDSDIKNSDIKDSDIKDSDMPLASEAQVASAATNSEKGAAEPEGSTNKGGEVSLEGDGNKERQDGGHVVRVDAEGVQADGVDATCEAEVEVAPAFKGSDTGKTPTSQPPVDF